MNWYHDEDVVSVSDIPPSIIHVFPSQEEFLKIYRKGKYDKAELYEVYSNFDVDKFIIAFRWILLFWITSIWLKQLCIIRLLSRKYSIREWFIYIFKARNVSRI